MTTHKFAFHSQHRCVGIVSQKNLRWNRINLISIINLKEPTNQILPKHVLCGWLTPFLGHRTNGNRFILLHWVPGGKYMSMTF